LQNGTSWIQNYKECTNLHVDSIQVISNTFWNNDGIDLVDCKKDFRNAVLFNDVKKLTEVGVRIEGNTENPAVVYKDVIKAKQ
jgi:hypothetical protein